MRTIALVNQKGGCGKTTTSINLAAICAARGLRTLLIDMDPQSHCAAGLGVPEASIEQSIGNALLQNLSKGFQRSNLVWEVSRHLDLAPSTMALAGLEAPGGGLHRLPDKDRRLALLLRHLSPHYDRCFIDCPPNIGLLTYNALRASGEAIIPVETGYFSLKGAKKQWDTIRALASRVNHPISCYVLPTLFKQDEKLARSIHESIKSEFGSRVIPLVLRDHREIREAASFGQPVVEYAPKSDAVKDFEALADWLQDHPADPPEIQVEVANSTTVPFHLELEEDDDDDAAGSDGLLSPTLSSAGNSQTDTKAQPSSRAAEMARKVRNIALQRETTPKVQPAQLSTETAPKRSTAIVVVNEPPVKRPKPVANTATVAKSNKSATAVRSIGPVDAHVLAARRRATLIESKDMPQPITSVSSNLVRLFGVRQTAQGVLFLQPGAPDMQICVAGDFNNWSATASPLRYNREAGVYELILPLDLGRYEYRLVVDGQWQADPYNRNRTKNEFGDENNILELLPPNSPRS